MVDWHADNCDRESKRSKMCIRDSGNTSAASIPLALADAVADRRIKRGGGRRYYRPDDVDLLRGVRHLLYGEGYTCLLYTSRCV